MGIRVFCPNGHKLNVKAFLGGKKGICPHCGSRFEIPAQEANGAAGSPIAPPENQAGENPIQPIAASTVVHVMPQPTAANDFADAVEYIQPQAVAARQAVANPAPLAPSPAPVAAIVDPIAAAPGANWYLRPVSGGQFGPAQPEVMRQWVAEGRVSGDALVWRDGWSDWQQAQTVFTHLAVAASPAPAANDPFDLGDVEPASLPRVAPRRRRKGPSQTVIVGTVLAVSIVVLVIVAVIYFASQNRNKKRDAARTTAPAALRG